LKTENNVIQKHQTKQTSLFPTITWSKSRNNNITSTKTKQDSTLAELKV